MKTKNKIFSDILATDARIKRLNGVKMLAIRSSIKATGLPYSKISLPVIEQCNILIEYYQRQDVLDIKKMIN